MGCATSAPVEATTVSLDAGRRISHALDEADLVWKEGDQERAIAIILEAQAEHGPLLIGADATTFPVAIKVKLGTYHKAMGDVHGALKLFTAACQMAVEYLNAHREGTYLMISRYAESAVSAAHCRLQLLDEAVNKVKLHGANKVAPHGNPSQSAPAAAALATEVAIGPNPLSLDAALADEATLTPRVAVVDVTAEADGDFSLGDYSAEDDQTLMEQLEQKRKFHTDAVESLLLKCVNTIDKYHSHRSEMMVGPLKMLAELYEQLGMFDEAVRVIRRLSGVFLVKYGHSHPAYAQTRDWIARLGDKKEREVAEHAVTSIIKTCKMRAARVKFARRIGRDPDGAPLTPSPPDSDAEDEPSLLHPRPPPEVLSAAYTKVATVPDDVNADLELLRRLQAVPKHKGAGDTWLSEDVSLKREDNADTQSLSDDAPPNPPPRCTAFSIVPIAADPSPFGLPSSQASQAALPRAITLGLGQPLIALSAPPTGRRAGLVKSRGLWAITPAADELTAADAL